MGITIALAGNPNSGKTTLFNALTGSNQYVGNWPGVTVERKEARFQLGKEEALLVDLPGVYSLSPYSIEESITRHFIAQHTPDVVLNIVDATNLERNLYLTMQLMELERPVVIALNLIDEVNKRGGRIDADKLSEIMGVPVVPISAKKCEGFERLFRELERQANAPTPAQPALQYDKSTRQAVLEVIQALGGTNAHSAFDSIEHYTHRDENNRDDDHSAKESHVHIGGYADEGDVDHAPPTTWVALKLIEGDETLMEGAYLTEVQRAQIDQAIADYEARGREIHPGIDGMTLLADARYTAIEKALHEAGVVRRAADYGATTAKIDRIMTHKYLAFPIFFAVLALMFALTFGSFGTTLCDWVEGFITEHLAVWVENGLTAISSPDWVQSLILDGVIAGVGSVLVFLPQILLIFLFLSVLEDSGYMARAAFITDRLLRRLGLSGRSFIPMLMGFGCTTTAVIAARGVENERDRRMTIMLTPFMSCGAKLPVYGLFAAAFFAARQGILVFSLYMIGMLVMILLGLVLRKTTFREGDTPFLMELPQYRMPTVRNVMRRLWDRAKDFLTRAGTVIFAMSVLVWFMQNYSFRLEMVTDSQQSIFGVIGSFIAPIFKPLGFGEWEKSVALLSGLVAKEAVVSTMQVLYSAADSGALELALASQFTSLSAFSYLVFTLLYTPCISALAAMKRELGSWKHMFFALAMQLGTAYVVTLLVYQVGRLLGL